MADLQTGAAGAGTPTIPPPPARPDDKYEYSTQDRVRGLVNRLTGGGLPQVQQQIEEDHQRRLNEMNAFQTQMGTLSQAMTSGKDPATGEPLYDAQGNQTAAGLRLQHQWEMARDEYMKRASVSKNAKPIAEKVFDFAKNVIHHHVAGGGAGGGGGATPATASQRPLETPVIPPPPQGVGASPGVPPPTAGVAAAAPAAAAGPAPAVAPPPGKVGGNPTIASASNGAAPRPAASAPGGAGATVLPPPTLPSPTTPTATAPTAASSAPPAATTATRPTTTAAAASSPALPPPPVSPLMSAMGAPQLAAELGARNIAEAEALKLQRQYELRQELFKQFKKDNPGASPQDFAVYMSAVEGRPIPFGVLRGQKVTVAGPDGKPVMGTYDPYSHQYLDQNNEVIPNAAPYLKPRVGFGRDAQGFYSFGIDPATNKMIPGTEDRNTLPPSGYLEKIKQGHHYYVDDQNQIHDLPETTVTGPAVPATGKGAAPAIAPPPGHEARKKAATAAPAAPKPTAAAPAPAAGGNEGRVIGNKGPTGATRSRADAAEAIIPLIEGAKRQLADPDVRKQLGVLPGRLSEFERRLGDMDPKVAKLYGTLKSIYSLGGTMHGWRALKVAEEFEKAYGALHTNPDTLIGGLDSMTETAHEVYKAGYHHDIGETTLPPPPKGASSADDEIMKLVKSAKGAKK